MKQFSTETKTSRKYSHEHHAVMNAFLPYIHELEQVRDMDDEAWEAENFVELDPRALAWLLGIEDA